MRYKAFAFTFVAILWGTSAVFAESAGLRAETIRRSWGAPEPEPEPAKPPVFQLTGGVKAGGGGDVWTTPSRRTFQYQRADGAFDAYSIPIFDESRAGYNYSIGVYAEMRVLRHIGLEVGLFFTRHTMMEDTDWSYTEIDLNTGQRDSYRTTTEQKLVFTSFHIPIIFKGVLPLAGDRLRLSLGLGPEIAIGSYAFATFRHKKGDALPLAGDRSAFRDLGARTQVDTYLAILLGADVKAGDFRIPIDIKFAYNFAQPENYYDRIEYDSLPSDSDPSARPEVGVFNARNTLYFQLTVGVAFDFL
jgi:hypothetical protein